MSNSRIQIEVTLGAIFIIISAIFLLILGFQEETALASAEDIQTAEAIEVGAIIFETACAECHGLNGEGVIGPPLSDEHFFTERLSEVGWAGTLQDYIISTVAAGRPVSSRPEQWPGNQDGSYAMPSWSQDYGGPFRNDQIRDVAEFILNWEATATRQVSPVDLVSVPALRYGDAISRGRAVWTGVGGCAACHTYEGVSAGVVGPSVTDLADVAATRVEGQTAEDYVLASIVNPNEFIVEGYTENVMPQTFGETLTEDQINDLVAFLLGIEDAPEE